MSRRKPSAEKLAKIRREAFTEKEREQQQLNQRILDAQDRAVRAQRRERLWRVAVLKLKHLIPPGRLDEADAVLEETRERMEKLEI